MGAILIIMLGFLFVTVSSRLTGEVGSSSNPDLGHDGRDAAVHLPCLSSHSVGRRPTHTS